mmetsp:Transcript_1428/g.5212  ORF Transcript_1428/g.5212 Transcript_1428/m.5212 type:complete len:85 (+) Transcript_1428:227-481(+)
MAKANIKPNKAPNLEMMMPISIAGCAAQKHPTAMANALTAKLNTPATFVGTFGVKPTICVRKMNSSSGTIVRNCRVTAACADNV